MIFRNWVYNYSTSVSNFLVLAWRALFLAMETVVSRSLSEEPATCSRSSRHASKVAKLAWISIPTRHVYGYPDNKSGIAL